MLKISDLSENCYKSELDLFTIPPTQVAIESGLWDTIHPVSGYESNSTVEFRIPGDSLHYIDLAQTEVYVGVKIELKVGQEATTPFMNRKGTVDLTKDKDLYGYPVNNFMHSLFSDITVKFNNTIVEQGNYYPYRAYLEDLLNYDTEAKDNFLQRQCFFKDTAGQFDNFSLPGRETVVFPATGGPTITIPITLPLTNPKLETLKWEEGKNVLDVVSRAETNFGGFKRREFIEKNGLMKGRFHLDSFQHNRYMLNNVDIDISMRKSRPEFCLMYQTETTKESLSYYDIKFSKMYIKVRRVQVAPSVMLAHAMELDKGMNAKYPMKKVLVKPIALEYNSPSQILSNVHHGIMPNRVVLAFVATEKMYGTYSTNPFQFDHFNIESLCVKIASQTVPYSSPLEFKPETADKFDVTEAYSTLFSGIRETSNGISYKEYKNGFFIFAFNLTPDLCSEEHYNILRDGNMEVYLRFSSIPTVSSKPVTINMITYLEFDNILEVTKSRNILVNYQ